MHYRQLGRSGLTVSAVGLGCNNFGWRIDTAASRLVIDTAIDHGVTLFDTSNTYGNKGGSETALGDILGSRRDKIVLATKFGSDMGEGPGTARGSRRYIRQAVEDSLRRLQTDYIDLYQLHRPDPLTPMAETLRALDELVKEGKVRYIGSSNLTSWQIADADWIAKTEGLERYISAQNHLSLLDADPDPHLLTACEEFGVGFLPYFPLANGLLTGKHTRNEAFAEDTRMANWPNQPDDVTWDRIEALTAFAKERGHTILELAISGLLARTPVASVISGATKPEQVETNVAAADWELTEEDLVAIDEI
jgi:aryl-alcohol dehydrogenase-like predicted oxidoreductase